MSVRDEDDPKLIVNSVKTLTDNDSYVEHSDNEVNTTVQESKEDLMSETNPMSPLSMYLSMYAASNNTNTASTQNDVKPMPQNTTVSAQKIEKNFDETEGC